MSEKDPKAPATAAPKASVNVVALLVTAVFAGAAAFGGAKVAGARAAGGGHGAEHAAHSEPPGPTIALDPFLVMANDGAHRTHAMRVSLAIEFEQSVKEDSARVFVPRIRDTALTYLRGLSFENASDSDHTDHLRAELLQRFRGTGAPGVSRVLVTDLVIQ